MAFFSRLFKPTVRQRQDPTPDAGSPQHYQVFTREFDEIANGSDLPNILRSPPDRPDIRYDAATQHFNRRFQQERLEIYEAAAPLIRKLVELYSADQRKSMIVSFLIDHSGSMKGVRMISALIAVECAVSIFNQCAIGTEILGFTTRNWHGGDSRKKWRRAGSPRNPGRLCELRHIVYKSAGDLYPRNLHYALHPDLLRENIDGEALEWAASRLSSDRWTKRAICFLTDGAPVDNATLLANDNPRILLDHLLETESKLQKEGMQIGHLLLSGDAPHRSTDLSQIAYEPETAGKALINIVTRMFFPDETEELTMR